MEDPSILLPCMAQTVPPLLVRIRRSLLPQADDSRYAINNDIIESLSMKERSREVTRLFLH
jgi:hypothetical protein